MENTVYLVKRDVVEAMLAGTKLKNDAAFVERIKNETGYEVGKAPADIELATVTQVHTLIARQLFPELPLEQALWQTGRSGMEGYRQTPAGKILLAAIGVWGTARTIRNAPQIFSGVLRYGKRRVNQLEPKHYQIIFEDSPAEYNLLAGVTHAVLEASGAKNVQVEIITQDAANTIFDIRWE